ncbi:HoxN/HupN/NixA family nickel/cobalt transporter [Nitrospina gracilis]|uniref:HoxN/HupN/NixA family nickel/cobalt transporter n=1 Tax=Nitrospina gracilis TaxID=35801 RepID=UPI001F2AA201|nr:HupE/UreJ family protein [Nitrospina gracilis]MCF8719610.1 high-affinity nickel-transport protein [Nitrospina gracilis Nb-211]
MEYGFLLAGGFLLGCLHALDADHVATVSSLLLDRRSLKQTVFLALRWALGHSLTLLLLAGLITPLREVFAEVNLGVMERVVGLSMIYLAGWLTLREVRKQRAAHAEEHGLSNRSGWMLFGMGVLHGTAGWAGVLLLVPVALFQFPAGVIGYIALFCLGMIVTMAVYATMVNRVTAFEHVARHLGKIRYATAAITLAIGARLAMMM